jgi:4-diphosphocytidyl-2-C-methyl-D-erythritol kinase
MSSPSSGRAPAKINLGLAVTGVRPDGYHELASVFLRLELADTLRVTTGATGVTDTLEVVGDPDCPVDGNLVLRAAAALRAATALASPPRHGPDLPPLAFTLQKRIPMGGGLAGGSTDAATALRLATAAWGLTTEPDRLLTLAAHLGADVPFFVAGHAAALISGIGERIEPLPPLRSPVGVVLVTPSWGMPTPAVFKAFDRLPARGAEAGRITATLVERWQSGLDGADLAAEAPGLREANDLWHAVVVLEPRMARLRAMLDTMLGRPVLLTGSGSTLVALYPSPEAARTAADELATDPDLELDGIRVTATRDGRPQDEEPRS